MDWIASEDAFDNLARLITHIYINNAMAGSVDVHTQEYEDGIFVNRTAAGYEASATVTKTDTGGARLSGAAFAVDEWTGSGDNWTNVATGQTGHKRPDYFHGTDQDSYEPRIFSDP